MENQEQVEKQIEISIEAAQDAVAKKNAVGALFINPDFRLVFEELYFKEEPARLVSLLTDPEFSSDERQEELMRDMLGISSTRQFLINLHKMGLQMEQTIARSEAELEGLRNQEEEGE